MRHATHPLRSFPSPLLKRAASCLAAAPVVLLIPAARAADRTPVVAPVAAQPVAPAPAAPAAGSDVPPTVAAPAQAAPTGDAPVVDAPVAAPAAPAPAAAEAKSSKILVLPFDIVGGRPGDAWLGRSIQQSVMTDLMTASASQVVSASETPADAAAARDLGRKLGVRYVVFGQVHVNNASVRVTGEILSTETDQPVAALKATGAMTDLFPLEDVLGNQARRALGRLQFADLRAPNPGSAPAAPPPAYPPEPPTVEPSGPVQAPYGDAPEVPYTYTPYPEIGVYSGGAPLGYDPYPVYGYPDYGFADYPFYPGYIIGGYGFVGRGFNRGYGGYHGYGGSRFGGVGHVGGYGHGGGGGHMGGGGHVGGVGHAGGGAHGGGHR